MLCGCWDGKGLGFQVLYTSMGGFFGGADLEILPNDYEYAEQARCFHLGKPVCGAEPGWLGTAPVGAKFQPFASS